MEHVTGHMILKLYGSYDDVVGPDIFRYNCVSRYNILGISECHLFLIPLTSVV